MNYFLRHWRGQLSLTTSFWINFVAITLLLVLINSLNYFLDYAYDPRKIAILALLLQIFTLGLCLPWQLVGLFRAARHQQKQRGKTFWPGVLIIFIFCTCLFHVYRGKTYFLMMKENYALATTSDENTSYALSLADKNTVIIVKGFLGFGLTNRVGALLKSHPTIKGIVLDSDKGRFSEAFILAEVILGHHLDTTSAHGCQSVCVIPYIAGNHRTLEKGARLSFASYETVQEDPKILSEYAKITQKVENLYMRQNVDQTFINEMLDVPYEQFWQPSREELMAANVIQNIQSFHAQSGS